MKSYHQFLFSKEWLYSFFFRFALLVMHEHMYPSGVFDFDILNLYLWFTIFFFFYSSLSVSQRILIFLELFLLWHGNTFQKYFIIFCNIPSDIRFKIGLALVTKLKTVILGLLWYMIMLHYKLWFPYIFHMLMVYGYAFVRHKITGYI